MPLGAGFFYSTVYIVNLNVPGRSTPPNIKVEPAFRAVINKAEYRTVNTVTVIIALIFFIDLALRTFLGSNFLGK